MYANLQYSLTWRGKFDAAHHLPGHSRCGVKHGHSYYVLVCVEGTPCPDHGMIMDFGKIKGIVACFDHCDLNEIVEVPTAENLAAEICVRLYSSLGDAWGERVSGIAVTLSEGGYNDVTVRAFKRNDLQTTVDTLREMVSDRRAGFRDPGMDPNDTRR